MAKKTPGPKIKKLVDQVRQWIADNPSEEPLDWQVKEALDSLINTILPYYVENDWLWEEPASLVDIEDDEVSTGWVANQALEGWIARQLS